MELFKLFEMMDEQYIKGWDDTVPSFQGKWTRTDMTPQEWAQYMFKKLEMTPPPGPQSYINGVKDALKAFLKNGKIDFISTSGQYNNDPNAPPPFSNN